MTQPEPTRNERKIDVEWELEKANQRYLDTLAEITKLRQEVQSINAKIARLKLTVKRELEPEDVDQITDINTFGNIPPLTELDILRKYEELKKAGVIPRE